MTMSSVTFDRVDVREIGLRSLVKLEIVGTLGKGGTLASFHTRGTLHSRKEVFKISAIGKARISALGFEDCSKCGSVCHGDYLTIEKVSACIKQRVKSKMITFAAIVL